MGLFDFFVRRPLSSKDVAKDRIKLVLIHDRVDCSADTLEMLKNDILKVISNYLIIDEEELEIQISQTAVETGERAVPVLLANIPIKSVRRGSQNVHEKD